MTRIPLSIMVVGLGALTLLSLAASSGPRSADSTSLQTGTTGFVSRVGGDVRVITPYPVREGTALASGSWVVLDDGEGNMVLLCGGGMEVTLTGPVRWQVSAENCTRDGRRSDRRVAIPGGYGRVGAMVAAADGGRVEYDERATPRRLYPSGSRFQAKGDNARVAILCSTDAFVLRQNPRDWTLSADACAQDGAPVASGAYRDLVGFASIRMRDPSAELLLQPSASGPPQTVPGCRAYLPTRGYSVLESRRPGTQLRPPAVDVPFGINFINGLCGPIRVSSMDSMGAWVRRGDVESNGYADFGASLAQPWLVEAESNTNRAGPPSWAPIAIFLAGERQIETAFVGPDLAPRMGIDRGTPSAQDGTAGVVSRVSGGVRVTTPFPLREGMLLAPGGFVALDEGDGSVVVICADESQVHLTAPSRWQVGMDTCQRDGERTGRLEEVLAISGQRPPRDGYGFRFWGAVVANADGGRVEYEEPAVPRRLYPAGSVFQSEGDSARVAILCSTDAFVLRPNPRDWTLNAAMCARDGAPVEPGAFRDLVGFASLAMNDPSAELLLEPLLRVGTWPGCEQRLPLDDLTLLEPKRPGTPTRPVPVRIPVEIDFINGLCGVIRLSSMDSTGNWVRRGTVESDGYSPNLESWFGQPWRVEAESTATRPEAWAPLAIFLAGEQQFRTAYVGPALANAIAICSAVEARRRVTFHDGRIERRVEPFAVGAVVDRWSSPAVGLSSGLLAWQETPDSAGWVRIPDLSEIGGLRIRDAAETIDRPGFESEIAAIDPILCQAGSPR